MGSGFAPGSSTMPGPAVVPTSGFPPGPSVDAFSSNELWDTDLVCDRFCKVFLQHGVDSSFVKEHVTQHDIKEFGKTGSIKFGDDP